MTSTTSSTELLSDMPNNLQDNLQYGSYRLSQFGKTGSELCTGIQVYSVINTVQQMIHSLIKCEDENL